MLAGIGQRMVLELRRDLFEHLTSLSLRYFSEQKAGWIIARLTSDVDALSDVLNQGLTTLVVNTLTLVAAIGGLFLLDWRLGLVALLVLPPGIVVTRWFQRRSHVAFSDVRTRIAAVTAQLAESVAGMAVVQAFNRERAFQREFEDLNEANRVSNIYAQKLSSVFFPAIELLGVVAHGGGALRRRADDRRRCARDRDADRRRRDAVSSSSSRCRSSPSCTARCRPRPRQWGRSPPSSTPSTTSPTGRAPATSAVSRGGSSSTGVVFAYGEEPVIHGLELDDPRRRLHRARRRVGRRQVDDREADRALLRPRPGNGAHRRHRPAGRPAFARYRRQLGVVLQDPFLFSGTIADNIRFARPDATDEEVAAAARAIGVDRVAARFEEGLDHVVREGGAGLSAGERQLISIARALARRPARS